MLGAGNHPEKKYPLRVITGQGVRRGKDQAGGVVDIRHACGCVSGVVDLFRTTFVFGINSSGTVAVPDSLSNRQSGGGRFNVWYVRGV